MMISHTLREPKQIMAAYLSPIIYPSPKTAAPVLILNTSLAFSATNSPHPHTREVKFSFHHPKVATMKSYNPPINPAKSSGFAWLALLRDEAATADLRLTANARTGTAPLHLHLADALRYNALLVLSIPYIALLLFAEAYRTRFPKFYLRVHKPLYVWSYLAAVILWGVGRNLVAGF